MSWLKNLLRRNVLQKNIAFDVQEEDHKLYYYTEAGKTPRDENNVKNYILFIDLGSYRTSVLCWPHTAGREEITDAWKYIVKYNGTQDGGGFPSAFVNSGHEKDFAFIPDINAINIPSKQIVRSAKFTYASQFAAFKGKVPSFKLYIKKIIEESFLYITAPYADRPWNDAHIPRIIEIRVTVPDLFIENLREGYRQSIVDVCLDLSKVPKWSRLFPDNLDKIKTKFVTISSDESGSCELYFLNIIKEMPFWDLSHAFDREADLNDVEFIFAQRKRRAVDEEDELFFSVCHLDIGGLTTDASVVLLKSYKGKYLGITTTLLRKESFSEKRAGEYFKSQYDKYRKDNQIDIDKNWWESEEFIEKQVVNFLSIILVKQSTLLKEWKRERFLNGIYFLISGRPTKAPLIQQAIVKKILEIFNQEEIIILPDHCLFMANYRHIGKTIDGERYAKRIDDFEKLITILGNVYTLCDGYDVRIEEPRYYISIDVGQRGVTPHEIKPDIDYNLEDFEDYKIAAQQNKVVHIAFSKHLEGNSVTRFLTAQQMQDGIKYPEMRIADDNDDRAWIIPSIKVTNLEKHEKEFDLAWSHPSL